MARLQEWQELEERANHAGNTIQLKLDVSSENSRVDVMKSLRDAFAHSDEKWTVTGRRAWIYVSGPSGLLDRAEDACVDLERELKQAKKAKSETGLTISHIEHYVARWEV